ncbi:MAG: NAD(P)-dependent oxidoreductase [Chloroflexi bacterium]|nr:NAD(P)-dependent oxidoreductase [Chloroflexota bacterium]OJV95871.1 MAG: dTDP-glucose 4,6-dehydratase [Chloroflexi bacterium 54-19]
MKIFLAGAGGAIGRRLVPLLVRAGHDVIGTSRSEKGAGVVENLGAKAVIVDVYDREKIFAVLADARPDVLLHQLTDLNDFDYAANARLRVEGTTNLVDAALAAGVRRGIAQSITMAYAGGSAVASEEDPLDPQNIGVIALEKMLAEMPESVILRYGLFYGPGTWYAPDGEMAQQARRGELVATDGISSFVHIDDAARAALLALNWPPGAYNIVDDEPAPGTEWVPAFAEAVGAPPPPVQPGAKPSERGASNRKAHQLGWEPLYPTWRTGFRVGMKV